MGGYGSGRSGGRATTESGLVLSLPKLEFATGSFGQDAHGAARSSGRTRRLASGSARSATRRTSATKRGGSGSNTRQRAIGTENGASRTTGSGSRRRHSLSGAGDGGSSALERAGGS